MNFFRGGVLRKKKKRNSKTKHEIYADVEKYLKRMNCVANDFFVGITDNPRDTLFFKHNVNKDKGGWIYKKAITVDDAAEAKKLLTEKGMISVDQNASLYHKYVYCFAINQETIIA